MKFTYKLDLNNVIQYDHLEQVSYNLKLNVDQLISIMKKLYIIDEHLIPTPIAIDKEYVEIGKINWDGLNTYIIDQEVVFITGIGLNNIINYILKNSY